MGRGRREGRVRDGKMEIDQKRRGKEGEETKGRGKDWKGKKIDGRGRDGRV